MPAADTSSMARTVLLADDSPTIRRVVELTFAGEDVDVVAVGDGGAAIDRIRQTPPDVVLADIGMPGRGGYAVLEFVRSQPSLAHVPVLLLAGAFEPVDQAQATRLGADGVLSKPFEPALLVSRVTESIGRRRGPAAESHVPGSSTPPPPTPHQGPAPTTPMAAPPAASDRDRYFEEIDQAFAALARSPRPLVPPAGEEIVAETEEGADDAHPVGAPAEVESTGVPLTDAFAALLEAEQTGTPLETLWPQAAAGTASQPLDVERLADLVARRVLDKLTDRTLRETVSDIVSTTAERLVREEIERIKRHIK
jgi:CheY-like chemotaxis protein